MALSDEAVSKQIEHMIAFIKNESQEKNTLFRVKTHTLPGVYRKGL